MLRYAETILERFPSDNCRERFDYALCNRNHRNISSLLAETDRIFPIESEVRMLRDKLLKHGRLAEAYGCFVKKENESIHRKDREIWLCHLGLAYENGKLNTVKYYFSSQSQELFQQLHGQISTEYDALLEHADFVRKNTGAAFWMVGLDTGKQDVKCKIYLRRYKDLQLPVESPFFSDGDTLSRTLFRVRDWYRMHPEVWFEGTAFGLEPCGRRSLNLYFTRNG